MSSHDPEDPKTTETGEGGGYGDPTPEQELGRNQDPHREQAAVPQGGREAPGRAEQDQKDPDQKDQDRKDQDEKVRAQEQLAGEQQDPVTGEALGPGGAESPA